MANAMTSRVAFGEAKQPVVTGAVTHPPWSNSTPYLLEHLPALRPSPAGTQCPLPLSPRVVAAASAAHAVFDDACSASSLRVRVKEAGFFASLHSALADLIGAAAWHQHIVFDTLSIWQGKGCSHLSCYLAGMRKPCSASRAANATVRDQIARRGRAATRRGAMSFDRFSRVAALVAMLMEPSRLVAHELRRAKVALGWEQARRPIIGLHVRDGDSCNARERAMTHRSCGGLKAFMPRVRSLAARYKTRTIFLATDGKSVFNETARYGEFEWLMLPRERFQPTGAGAEKEPRVEERIASGTLDGGVLALESLVDMLLLAETDVLVGKFTSNLFRTAVEVRAGRRGCVPPVVSLDAAWCFGPDQMGGYDSGEVLRGRFAGDTFAC